MNKNGMKKHSHAPMKFRIRPYMKMHPAEVTSRRTTGENSVTGKAFLDALQYKANVTRTENGGKAYRSTGSDVLNLFACVGALRHMSDEKVRQLFYKAWAEDRDLALKILFYARDARGGLGERQVFRSILGDLAGKEPDSVRKNISLIPFYGRYDDLLTLLDTPCEEDVMRLVGKKLAEDKARLEAADSVSLLAKWLPSINASSEETRQQALRIAHGIGMTNAEYRKTLSALRSAERLLENRMRERDYSFNYSAQPSRAMFKYRGAFLRNDGIRYNDYLTSVEKGRASMHTSMLQPYELVRQAGIWNPDRKALNAIWNALEDYTDGKNSIAVIDVSGSMFWTPCGESGPYPIDVAVSLGLYFAERNNSAFKNTFISFSEEPELVCIKGADLSEKVQYIKSSPMGFNTDIQKVFDLILETACYFDLPQAELPETIYIISDMEFDACAIDGDKSSFEHAKACYAAKGYRLPNIVFWNVQSRHQHLPARMNDRGAALVSGFSPRIFSMVMKDEMDPYTFMMNVIGSKRYAPVRA